MSSQNIIALDMDHVYLNLQIENESYTSAKDADLYKAFGEPIINNPSLFHTSLIKAEIPTSYVPLFNWSSYCSNPLSPVSEISISYTYRPIPANPPVATFTRFLTFPTLQFVPNGPNPIYHIDQLVAIVNTTFTLLYTDITTAYPALIPALGGPPVLVYNPPLQVFAVQYPTGFTSNVANPSWAGVEVYFNAVMYNFFDTMPYIEFVNNAPQLRFRMKIDEVFTLGSSNRVNRTGLGTIPAPEPPTTGLNYYSMIQETSSLTAIYSVSSIIFSSTLPLVPEYLTSATVSGGVVQLPILAEVPTSPGDTAQRILYNPTAEFRLRNLSSNDPITNINIQVYYKDKNGALSRLIIPPRETLNLKILFRKKTYGNSYLYALNSLSGEEKREVLNANFLQQR